MDGEVERRLLVNYRVDPAAITRVLPSPFRPALVDGWAVAGICLIRLGHLRPRGVPRALGLRSENAAHRVAVTWDDASGSHTGVYIPRRDTNSAVNALVGGRLYPGEHHRARFEVHETGTDLSVAFTSDDRSADVSVRVRLVDSLSDSAVFPDLASASAFFERGAVGFSATKDSHRLDGLELRTSAWRVEAGQVLEARSSFFDDVDLFPPGSAQIDCALVMRHVPVSWYALPSLRADETPVAL